MTGQRRGSESDIVALAAYVDPLSTTDGRVPGARGRQTRQRLLTATVDLLTTTPWRSVTVTDIARRARTSPGFEFWGIRTRHLIDTQARLLHWAVTGRPGPVGYLRATGLSGEPSPLVKGSGVASSRKVY
jgi:hypothetical protein